MDVLRKGRLSYGPYSRRFEAEWAKAHGCKYAQFCNSGTSALHVAVAALKKKYGWKDGDEVLVPATTFVATANVVLHNNLTPVFVDVDPHSYNLNPAEISNHIGLRSRAIIPVHLCGLPADMEAISHYAKKHHLAIIEDSCETAFADCHGKKVGSWGEIGCFSTYMAHYIVTGVGGLTTTNDPDLAVTLRSLMNHGRDSIYISIDDDNNLTGDKLKEMISRRFQFTDLGHSFRCTELEAALGCAQLERADEIVRLRKAVASRYYHGLSDLTPGIQLPSAAVGLEHVYMLFPLVTSFASDKTELTQYLEEHGVETRDLLPLINQPVYTKLFGRDLRAEYPVAARLLDCGFYIGCHQYITEEDTDHAINVINKCYLGK